MAVPQLATLLGMGENWYDVYSAFLDGLEF